MQTNTKPKALRRAEAAEYLRATHGIPVSKNWLDKAATKGNGPAIRYFGAVPLYPISALDEWAEAALSKPTTSTAGRRAQAAAA